MQDVQDFIHEARKFFFMRRTKFRGPKKARTGFKQTWHGPWGLLGSGYYGEAWAHDDYPDLALKISGPAGWGYNFPHAIKISMRCDEDTPRPDVWPEFAKVCMQNPHPNLPRILHFEQAGGMAWGVMPKYEGTGDLHSGPVQDFKNALMGRRVAEAWMLPLFEIARGLNVQLDLHSGNVMQDPETLETVIIDPFSRTGYGYNESYEGLHAGSETDYWSDTYTDGTDETTDCTTDEGELQC